MNNNSSNNNGNNDLNAFSLGSVDNLNPNNIEQVPLENLSTTTNVNSLNSTDTNKADTTNSVDNLNAINDNSTTVVPLVNNGNNANESLDTTNINNANINSIPDVNNLPPVPPVSYDIPETINNFNTTSVFNDIGTVPPINNSSIPTPIINNPEPKKGKKVNKLLFVIIIVLLIAAIGVGVYIFLNVSKPKVSSTVTVKEVSIEAGSSVSTNINDYATFKGIDSSSCSLDTSQITDTNALDATYTFNITCGTKTYSGTAKIVDTTAPTVTLKEVTVQINSELKPEDFVLTCTDASECSYEFSDNDKVQGFLSAAGNYHVDIIVKDANNNETEVTGTLIVVEDEVPELYLSCTANNEEIKLGITSSVFTGSIKRIYTFKLNASDYEVLKAENNGKEEITYQNITGVPSFNDDDSTLIITITPTVEAINSEFNGSLPNAYGELRQYFIAKGYSCALEQP